MEKILKRAKHVGWKLISLYRQILVFLPIGRLRPNYFSRRFKIYNSNIGVNGQSIWLKGDRVIAPYVNKFGYYDLKLVQIICEHLESINSQRVFLDIGSNQGLITLQVGKKLGSLKDFRMVCLEPVKMFYNNLVKNLDAAGLKATTYNFGLDEFSNLDAKAYRSKRNATSTLIPNLSSDASRKLIHEKIKVFDVNYFIDKFLNFSNGESIAIKSDTDGSDIVIFNSWLESELSSKIDFYVLEISSNDLVKINFDRFIANCSVFSCWILKHSNGELIFSRNQILRLFETCSNFRGDLILKR